MLTHELCIVQCAVCCAAPTSHFSQLTVDFSQMDDTILVQSGAVAVKLLCCACKY